MFQIDNVNESKEFLPRIPPLSQSTEIKLRMRPAIVTVSLKAIMKKLMETQTVVVILCNDAKSDEAVPGALIAYRPVKLAAGNPIFCKKWKVQFYC